MIIKKTIEVTVEACDICHKPTSRNKWNYGYLYKFCKKHSWVEDILTTLLNNKKSFDRYNNLLPEMVNFLKEELYEEENKEVAETDHD